MKTIRIQQRIWVDEKPYTADLEARECSSCAESVVSGTEMRRAADEIRKKVGSYNGKLLLRMAPAIHKSLADLADQQGVSINELVKVMIEDGLKRKGQAA